MSLHHCFTWGLLRLCHLERQKLNSSPTSSFSGNMLASSQPPLTFVSAACVSVFGSYFTFHWNTLRRKITTTCSLFITTWPWSYEVLVSLLQILSIYDMITRLCPLNSDHFLRRQHLKACSPRCGRVLLFYCWGWGREDVWKRPTRQT